MNSYLKVPVYFLVLILALTVSSCKDGFLDAPPEDAINLDAFYATNEQVNASTNILYGVPWFHWNTKAFWSVGELMSGNARTFSGDVVNFGNFSLTGDNQILADGWSSLWGVVAQANALINNLEQRAGDNVSQEAINNALGEAHVMRAAAYFYLVRTWGPVPIVENNLDYVYSPQIPRHRVQDVYEFIRRDLEFAIKNCRSKIRGSNYEANAHVSSGSAKALLAKVELYAENYERAEKMAEEVIASGEFKLYGVGVKGTGYSDLFYTQNNNNEESIIALQWDDERYGTGNAMQASFAHTTAITGTGDGYGVIGPTIDLQNAYEDGDLRRKATLMDRANYYPQIRSADGGYTVPDDVNAAFSHSAIKKYVVGTPGDNDGVGAAQATEINTYIMRYADVLLIHAEATLGDVKYGSGKTLTDQNAIDSFNTIRERAGLDPMSNITKADIIHERRIEFTIEGDYWYDLGRLNRDAAINIISNQQRGFYNTADGSDITSQVYSPTHDDFTLPYPSGDVAINENLTKPPVKYDFGDE